MFQVSQVVLLSSPYFRNNRPFFGRPSLLSLSILCWRAGTTRRTLLIRREVFVRKITIESLIRRSRKASRRTWWLRDEIWRWGPSQEWMFCWILSWLKGRDILDVGGVSADLEVEFQSVDWSEGCTTVSAREKLIFYSVSCVRMSRVRPDRTDLTKSAITGNTDKRFDFSRVGVIKHPPWERDVVKGTLERSWVLFQDGDRFNLRRRDVECSWRRGDHGREGWRCSSSVASFRFAPILWWWWRRFLRSVFLQLFRTFDDTLFWNFFQKRFRCFFYE